MSEKEKIIQEIKLLEDAIRRNPVSNKLIFRNAPYLIDVFKCDKCGNLPSLLKTIKQKGNRYVAICKGCQKRSADESKSAWDAKYTWNSINISSVRLKDYLWFDTANLSINEARTRLSAIRSFLENKKKILKLQSKINQIEKIQVGVTEYIEVDCLLKLSVLGLKILKNEESTKDQNS